MTKKLIKEINKVNEEYVIELEMGMNHIMKLNDVETFNVMLLDANHCPGAVMFLFEGYFGHILATGNSN
jgi:DNA cross-link repair 1B protein